MLLRKISNISATVLLLALVPLLAGAVERVSVEDFFKLPESTAWQISKDGKYLSYLAPWKSRLNIFVQDVEGFTPANRVTSVESRDIGQYFWANGTQLLYLNDFGGDENFHLYRVNFDGTKDEDLTPFKGAKVRIVDELKDIDDEILISINNRDPKVFDVYRLNLTSGQLTQVAENPGNINGWMADHEGKLRLAIATDGTDVLTLYRKQESDPFEEILRVDFRDSIYPVAFTYDNKQLYMTSNLGRDKEALVLFDPLTKKEVKKIYEHPKVDVNEVLFSDKRKKLTGLSVVNAKKDYIFFDKQTESIQSFIEAQVPGEEMRIASMNKNEDRFLIRSFSDRTRGSYYYYNLETGLFKKLADTSPWIKKEDMAEIRPIKYIARDGLVIPGYLTLPKGVAPKNLPVVVHPHGGPQSRDYWTFDPQVQLLANRGYAVLQMNFRGSTGYGKRFEQAGFKQWGRAMQDDITDGVQWLIDEGIADPKKVAIFGASYGGYAALAGLAFTPDLYACGVSYVGVSNLFTLMASYPPYWLPFIEMSYERIGNPKKDEALFRAISPVFHVDRIKAPLFVAQGANDVRVKKAESDQIVEALRSRGVPVKYLVKDNEGHGFHNEENQIEFYKELDNFLQQYL